MSTEENRFELRLTPAQIGKELHLDAAAIGRIVSFIKARHGIDLRQLPYSVTKPGPSGFSSQYYNGAAVKIIYTHAVDWLKDSVSTAELSLG